MCSNVSTEPELQPITGAVLRSATSNSQPGARLNVAANVFWGGRFQKTYLDVRIFNPFAPSNSHSNLTACYCIIKKRAYEQRIRIPHSPHSFSLPPEVLQLKRLFYKRLASLYTCNEMGSTLLLHPVLATLPPKFIFTKISNPVHSWGPLKRWSSHEDTAPYGPGYVRTPNQMNSAST